ncbi:MAG: polyprenyl synthetase family protein [Bacteroidia bacterium]|nr:polyprenyl synthetase family protein [Bacteroidia bacterium]
MNNKFDLYFKRTETELAILKFSGLPQNIYEPMNYILHLGGKRIRPILTFVANDMFGGDIEKAVAPAISSEIFHNFSLIHDDILDKAPLRRGKPTVHTKWNIDTAILSGDLMLVKAYEIISKTESKYLDKILKIFNKTASQICEGQQMDMNFETQENVSETEYLDMIKLKTSVLLGCCLKMGAITADASNEECEKVYNLGVNMGMGFQLMDDYLDSFGNSNDVGKQTGGDILERKKTILYIKAAERDNDNFLSLINDNKIENTEKVERVKSVFIKTGADLFLKNLSEKYFIKSLNYLDEIDVAEENKKTLRNIIDFLRSRNN